MLETKKLLDEKFPTDLTLGSIQEKQDQTVHVHNHLIPKNGDKWKILDVE